MCCIRLWLKLTHPQRAHREHQGHCVPHIHISCLHWPKWSVGHTQRHQRVESMASGVCVCVPVCVHAFIWAFASVCWNDLQPGPTIKVNREGTFTLTLLPFFTFPFLLPSFAGLSISDYGAATKANKSTIKNARVARNKMIHGLISHQSGLTGNTAQMWETHDFHWFSAMCFACWVTPLFLWHAWQHTHMLRFLYQCVYALVTINNKRLLICLTCVFIIALTLGAHICLFKCLYAGKWSNFCEKSCWLLCL